MATERTPKRQDLAVSGPSCLDSGRATSLRRTSREPGGPGRERSSWAPRTQTLSRLCDARGIFFASSGDSRIRHPRHHWAAGDLRWPPLEYAGQRSFPTPRTRSPHESPTVPPSPSMVHWETDKQHTPRLWVVAVNRSSWTSSSGSRATRIGGRRTELNPAVTNVRIMDPVIGGKYPHPNGYVVYMNKDGQTINPFTGRTLKPADPFSHLDLKGK